MQSIHILLKERNYEALVRSMIGLNQICFDIIQKNPNQRVDFSHVEKLLQDTIIALNQNMDHLLAFAYQLRKQDHSNMHTNLLLDEVVKPPALVDVILANYWDEEDQLMKCDIKKTFKLKIGEN